MTDDELHCGHCHKKHESTETMIGIGIWVGNPNSPTSNVGFCKDKDDCIEARNKLWKNIREYDDAKPFHVPGCNLGERAKDRCSTGKCVD